MLSEFPTPTHHLVRRWTAHACGCCRVHMEAMAALLQEVHAELEAVMGGSAGLKEVHAQQEAMMGATAGAHANTRDANATCGTRDQCSPHSPTESCQQKGQRAAEGMPAAPCSLRMLQYVSQQQTQGAHQRVCSSGDCIGRGAPSPLATAARALLCRTPRPQPELLWGASSDLPAMSQPQAARTVQGVRQEQLGSPFAGCSSTGCRDAHVGSDTGRRRRLHSSSWNGPGGLANKSMAASPSPSPPSSSLRSAGPSVLEQARQVQQARRAAGALQQRPQWQ